jgi:MarR family transcriptional regulator, transcriptional regulator for hemolysin
MSTASVSPSSSDEGFGFILHDVARLLRKRFDQRARALGFTRAQWQVLAHLARNEGIHQTGLADILEIENITLGRLIDRLEEAGWVERRLSPSDRRVRLLFLTEKAKPIHARMQALGKLTREEALSGLSAGQQADLYNMLRHVRANLSERNAASEKLANG